MEFIIREISSSDREYIFSRISESWGSCLVASKGRLHDTRLLKGFVASSGKSIKGVVIYRVENSDCEIVVLNSFAESKGIGKALVLQILKTAKTERCRRVWLITTNDNTKAIRFYQKNGFEMKALHKDAINLSRKLKPEIPWTGNDGIPIKHEIEFEKILFSDGISEEGI